MASSKILLICKYCLYCRDFICIMKGLRIHRILILLLINIVLANSASAKSDSTLSLMDIPILKRIESTEYNGGIQNWDFDQDSSGVLFVANNEGLLEFDGVRWVHHDVPNCTKVRVVHVDKQNRIFVGGQGQIGYFYYTDQGYEFRSLLDLIPEDYSKIAETWEILELNGTIYFNTESQILAYRNNKIQQIELPGYISFAFNTGDQIIGHFYDIGLYKLVNDRFEFIPESQDIPELSSVFKIGDQHIYFLRNGEIFLHENGRFNKVEQNYNLGTINSVIRSVNGDYIIGTQNNGLYFLSEKLNLKKHLTKNEGISDRTVKALYQDDFRNLWVALNNGIDYLELSLPLSLINDEVGLEGTGYVAQIYKGIVYLGTNNGLFKRSNDSRISRYELVPGSEGQVYNLSIVDGMLIINHHFGAYILQDDSLVQFYNIGSWKFSNSNIPGLYFGGDYQGISIFTSNNNSLDRVGGIDGLNFSSRMFEFESDTVLWMSHGSQGAYRISFRPNSNDVAWIREYGEGKGFPSNIMISVYRINDNLLFTGETGVYNYNNESDQFIPNQFFNKWFGKNHISEIASDGNNTLFFIQNLKLGTLKQEAFGTYSKETGIFKHINKYINDDLPNVSIIDDENVLIGAKEGFIRYNTSKKFSRNKDFKVLLRSMDVRSSNDSVITYIPEFVNDISIQKNQSVTFKYASPYFDGMDEVKYSFRLLPLDKNWSDWSRKGEMEYPYLPSRTYTFEVKAQNVYGDESDISSFSFVVQNPWYLSAAAILIYTMVGLVLIVMILLFQQKRHKVEKTIIVQSKEREIKVRDEEIDQISKSTKEEINRLTNEKLKSEIDLKNDQLTTVTMNLMNKSEFIQDVRDKIEASINEGVSKQELNRILRTIDENITEGDSWDQFAYHFDQVHGGYLQKLAKSNIKLSPREIKLAAFLRMNMSSKEISNLMNITVRGVELARYRLRKKLKLSRDQNLVEYLIDLDTDTKS